MNCTEDILKRHSEGIFYLFFGALTVIVSWLSYALFVWLDFDVNVSNILSWVCAVSFAFVVNKWFVFLSRSIEKNVLIKEISSFFFLRIFTGLVRIAVFPLLYYSLELNYPFLEIDGLMAVIVVTVIEIVLNYLASKFIVFRTKKENTR